MGVVNIGATFTKGPPRTHQDDFARTTVADHRDFTYGPTYPCDVKQVLTTRRYAEVMEAAPRIRRQGFEFGSATDR